jgi:hypothetical protein
MEKDSLLEEENITHALKKLESGDIDGAIQIMREAAKLTESIHGCFSLEAGQSFLSLALLMLKKSNDLNSLKEAREWVNCCLEIRKEKKGNIDVTL